MDCVWIMDGLWMGHGWIMYPGAMLTMGERREGKGRGGEGRGGDGREGSKSNGTSTFLWKLG